jgi:hypothetical protein
MCYEQCDSGYDADGGTCWQDCPAEFTDYGQYCHHDLEIVAKESKSRGIGTFPICGGTDELVGARCYPRCASGYASDGLFCRKPCPNDYVDDGVTCRKPEVIKWKDSYWRTNGRSKTCGTNEQKQGSLCYPKCSSGYYGDLMYCYKSGCASKHYDNGPSCYFPGHSFWSTATCPSGYRDDGWICTKDPHTDWKKKYYRGAGRWPHTCSSGYEKDGDLCYPKCSSGYYGVANYCWEECADGFIDDPATCRIDVIIEEQESYGRGWGSIPRSCPSGKYLDEDLCYPQCESGWDGVATRCYKDCASKYTDDDLFCRIDDTTFPKDFYQRDGFYP